MASDPLDLFLQYEETVLRVCKLDLPRVQTEQFNRFSRIDIYTGNKKNSSYKVKDGELSNDDRLLFIDFRIQGTMDTFFYLRNRRRLMETWCRHDRG